MSIVTWNPFREMAALQQDMHRLFARMDGGEETGGKSWMLPMDVFETADCLKLKTALPGVDPQDVSITVQDNVLTVSGQRRFEEQSDHGQHRWIEQQYGSFSRSLTLPVSVATDKIEANYNNGVLELTIPKREESKTRRIELTSPGRTPRSLEAADHAPATTANQGSTNAG